jgi:hypothetical protein
MAAAEKVLKTDTSIGHAFRQLQQVRPPNKTTRRTPPASLR